MALGWDAGPAKRVRHPASPVFTVGILPPPLAAEALGCVSLRGSKTLRSGKGSGLCPPPRRLALTGGASGASPLVGTLRRPARPSVVGRHPCRRPCSLPAASVPPTKVSRSKPCPPAGAAPGAPRSPPGGRTGETAGGPRLGHAAPGRSRPRLPQPFHPYSPNFPEHPPVPPSASTPYVT